MNLNEELYFRIAPNRNINYNMQYSANIHFHFSLCYFAICLNDTDLLGLRKLVMVAVILDENGRHYYANDDKHD